MKSLILVAWGNESRSIINSIMKEDVFAVDWECGINGWCSGMIFGSKFYLTLGNEVELKLGRKIELSDDEWAYLRMRMI